MNIDKHYFDDEVEGWSDLAIFFGLNLDEELENDFEHTKDLFENNHKTQAENGLIKLYRIDYNNKTMFMLSDVQAEAVYTIR